MCTFLVPLGALAWLGQRELGRQADQVRSAADREGLQFLRTAAQALEQRFEAVVPAVEQECETLLAERTPAATVRELRARGFGAVLDLVLIGPDCRLRYPESGSSRLALPFHRDARTRGAGDASADTLHLVDLLLTHGKFEDAERHLIAALADAEPERERMGRRRGEQTVLQLPLQFRLATVQRRLGKAAEAEASFRLVADQATALSANPRNSRSFDPVFDSDWLTLGLLAEVALAELARVPETGLELLAAIARGDRDHLGDALLNAVADRLLAGAPETHRTAATDLWTEAGIHLHARAFATDYDRLLRETVRRRLRLSPDLAASNDTLSLRPVITAGNPSSLLLLRRATESQQERAAWIGLRLDLGQMLASAIEPFVHGDGSFVLAIADSDDQPVIGAPHAPNDYVPPALATHGMVLRAFPADVDRYLQNIGEAKRSAALLLGGSFLLALIGAIWLWRSVSRESELLSLKVDLVSRVSHELKTPLSLISLYGETLALNRARDSEQAAHFGTVIVREAGRLTTMIQRILDFSRQEAGTMVYERRESDLSDVIHEVTDTYQPHLQSKGASLTTDLPAGILASVDRAALGSVVLNLLENAVKYAREDEPGAEIRIELRRRDNNAEIDVQDRGRGIPSNEREAVFDSFYRASNAGEVRGAGLGLSLVRHFATAHGGTAVVLPRDGHGCIFRLTLPLLSPST